MNVHHHSLWPPPDNANCHSRVLAGAVEMNTPFIALCPEITRSNALTLTDWLEDEAVTRYLSDSRNVSGSSAIAASTNGRRSSRTISEVLLAASK